MKFSQPTILFGVVFISGCTASNDTPKTTAPSSGLSHLGVVDWDISDLREEDKSSVYIMNEVKDSTSRVLTDITCEGSAKPKIQAIADKKWPSPKFAVQIKFDQGLTTTQVWLATGVRAAAPNPAALFKSFLAHNFVQITYPSPDGSSKELTLSIDHSATTLAPVAAFCGLGGDSDPVKLQLVKIRGNVIARLMTSDEVFKVLTPADEIGKPKIKPDEQIPGSLIVVHTYSVSGKRLLVSFKRTQMDGPYRVSEISWLPR